MNEERTRGVLRTFLLGSLLATAAVTNALADDRTPNQVIEETANTLARRVDTDYKRLEANPADLYALVDQVLLPQFDTQYAGRLVLGRHWRDATAEQQSAFIRTFYDFLVRSYSSSVLQFRRNNITILPAPSDAPPDPKRTVVRTNMRLDDGSDAPVDYSLHQTPDGWRIFDVNIEGISYVQNYRKQFDLEISAKGLDAVIARLQAETPPAPAPADSGGDATGPGGDGAGADATKAAHGPVVNDAAGGAR